MTLFDTQPIKGMKPDGRIERRGRPIKRDANGQRICVHCNAPIGEDGQSIQSSPQATEIIVDDTPGLDKD